MSDSSQPIQWYRSPVPRDQLRELTRRNDARALAQTLGHLLLLGATGAAVWVAWDRVESGEIHWVFLVAAIFLHGTFWAFLVNAFHELVHGTVFKTKRLGTFFLYLVSLLDWMDPVSFSASHRRHHLYTLHPPRDLEVVVPWHLRLLEYFSFAIVDPVGLWRTLVSSFRKLLRLPTSSWNETLVEQDGPQMRIRLQLYTLGLLLFHGSIVAISAITGLWQLTVVIVLPRFYGRWLQFLCNVTQHLGLPDETPDFRICCRTFLLGPLLRFLYWQMNYHTEHHMYAAVPCYNLRRLNRIVADDLPASRRGLIAVWVEIVGILRKQRKDHSYRFYAEVPE